MIEMSQESDTPSLSCLFQLRQLREIHFKRDDRHGDLPAFQDFGMDLTDETEGFACHDNPAGPAFEK